MTLTIDHEIAAVVREPFRRGREWRQNLEASILASRSPQLIYYWDCGGKQLIVDGIERYKLCEKYGIAVEAKPLDIMNKAEAIRMRWRLNVETLRNSNDFQRGEEIMEIWGKYFASNWKARVAEQKGGRGKRAAIKLDKYEEMGRIAGGIKDTTMKAISYIVTYSKNPRRKMPENLLQDTLRHLRANTKKPNSAANDIKNFEERFRRKVKRRKLRSEAPAISTIDWSAVGTQTSRLRKNWTDETNVVIAGDCLKILPELPYGLIDRFTFSPPYYLADGTSDEFFIEYGHDYRPFKSWDHYCNWTMRYLTDMWLLLPAGGYIVINITNTREPFNIPIQNNGKEKIVKNPIGGRFYFHTDLIRSIMRDIDVYCNLVTQTTLLEDEELNPLRPSLLDITLGRSHPLNIKDTELLDALESFGWRKAQPIDQGEVIWARSEVSGKKSARGSKTKPSLRPNHEYVLFFSKGEPIKDEIASTMRGEDLSKMTISTEDFPLELDEYQEQLWGTYWRLASEGNQARKRGHPAAFPPKVAARMIERGGSFGDVICDPFCGSGTSLFVAARAGREFIGIEQNPDFAKVSEQRGVDGLKEFQQEEVGKKNIKLKP
jgi:DNA modification methylase